MIFEWHAVLSLRKAGISFVSPDAPESLLFPRKIVSLQEVWVKPSDDKYFFKKSHATSYAVAVVVHMNLICEQLEKNEKQGT